MNSRFKGIGDEPGLEIARNASISGGEPRNNE